MIVVNDNLFTQQNWGGSPETLSKATILRTSFYQHMSALPGVYEKAREQAQVPSEVIMRNRDSSGAETIYFSEHSLRSAFLKKTLPVAEHLPGFTAIRSATSKVMELYFVSPYHAPEECLLEAGHCGCPGGAMQLVLEADRHDAEHIILYVPNECGPQVVRAAEAALGFAGHQKLRIRSATVIWGLGGIGMPAHKRGVQATHLRQR